MSADQDTADSCIFSGKSQKKKKDFKVFYVQHEVKMTFCFPVVPPSWTCKY